MADEQFVIFRLGDQEYGLPIGAVEEIARPPDHITRLPKAPAFIDGVINLRGAVVPIVDLRRRFELASKEPGGTQRILVLAVGGGKTGFMVDSVSEVLKVPADAIRPAPEVSPEQMRLIGRVANLEAQGRMILLVDPAQLWIRSKRMCWRSSIEPISSRHRGPRDQASDCRQFRADAEVARRDFSGGRRFRSSLARNGAEALELVRSFDPQVVTLDVQMPGMDGLTCLGRIMIEAPPPVVMISALTEDGAEATLEAMELGAVDFIAKPGGTVSLEIDRLRPLLVEKVRGAAKARIRPTLRLRERIRHQIRGAGVCRRQDARRHACRQESGQFVTPGGTGPDRNLDRRTGGARHRSPQLPRDALAGDRRAAHAGELHRAVCQAARRQCELDVVEVTGRCRLQAGTIYIGRGDADVIVAPRPTGMIAMPAPARRDYPWHPSVERMVTSALEHYGAEQLIGVLMTGMGATGRCHDAVAPAGRPDHRRGRIHGGRLGHARGTGAQWRRGIGAAGR